MLRIGIDRTGPYCDGLSRRSFVQLGVAGMATAGLSDIFKAKAAAEEQRAATNHNAAILIWLDGGPGHMDLYDLKPEAPAEYRGIWRPIKTNVPGMEISELFPLQAKVADKFSIVRSLHHDTGDHFAGAHRMLTTKNAGVSGAANSGKFPGLGALVAYQRRDLPSQVPPYVAIPYAASVGLRPGYFGGNFIGGEYNPFETNGDPNNANFKIPNLELGGGMTVDRLDDRKSLHAQLDRLPQQVERHQTYDAMDRFERQAYSFVSGEKARQAFDINSEDDGLREKYGRHSWGQSTLLARRLVESGASFVTVHFGGWDHHWNLKTGMESLLPRVDSAVASLLTDLDERGLLDTTLVMLCGEFSRTPRMNDGGNGGPPGSMGTPGRDHWGNSMFCLMAGGGVKGGQIVGATDSKGERPASRPVRPDHIHATAYRCLGLDPKLHVLDLGGRPTPVIEQPDPIEELL